MKKLLFFFLFISLYSCNSTGKKGTNRITMQEAEDILYKVFYEAGFLSKIDNTTRFFIDKVLDRHVVYKDTSKSDFFYLSDLDFIKHNKNIVLVDINDAMKSDKIGHFFDISFSKIKGNKLIINITFTYKFLSNDYNISTPEHSMAEYIFEKHSDKWIFKESRDSDSFIIE